MVLLKSTGDPISNDSFDRNIRIADVWIGLCDLVSKNTQRIMRSLVNKEEEMATCSVSFS